MNTETNMHYGLCISYNNILYKVSFLSLKHCILYRIIYFKTCGTLSLRLGQQPTTLVTVSKPAMGHDLNFDTVHTLTTHFQRSFSISILVYYVFQNNRKLCIHFSLLYLNYTPYPPLTDLPSTI